MFSNKRHILFFPFILLLILANTPSLSAQDSIRKPVLVGLGVESYFTMSGHGGFYSAFLAINKGKGTFKAGPVMHKRSQQITGAKMTYSYRIATMNGEDVYNIPFNEFRVGSIQVNLFAFLQYVQNTGLSYKRAVETQLLNIDSATVNTNWNATRLNTVEGGVGVELGIKITKRILWTSYIGLSVYDHLNYFPELYYEKAAVVLMVGTGLSIPTFRLKRKH